MARAGLGPAWQCLWANDFSPEKAAAYRVNWGDKNFVLGDVSQVEASRLPTATLAWASFPCQDLSLAGDQGGIGRQEDESFTRSGVFWAFWKLMQTKRPPIVVLENVVGALTSREGIDFAAICDALRNANYSFGPLVLDAARWLPQSRPRLFMVAVRKGTPIPPDLLATGPGDLWHPAAVTRAYSNMSAEARRSWIWWHIPGPTGQVPHLEDLISTDDDQWVQWDTKQQTAYLISLMAPLHRQKLEAAQALERRIVGTAYRRTRGGKQRAEVRFDGIAGCLRTAAGGSSKQIVIEVEGRNVRTRLLSPREAARLQGLPDSYRLPASYNDAYDLVGDGLAVPAVAHLRTTLLDTLAQPMFQVATA